MKYAIYEGNLDRLEKKLKRIFNKCKAYGCDFHYEQTGEEFRELKDEKGNKYTARFVLVEAEGTAVINDWEFVAELEHTEKGNIITGVAGIEVPERYYTTTPVCEHCNSKRYRKNTYIVRNKTTGEFKQVGKSCLKDFTHGMSAEAVTQYMSLFDTLIEGETPEPGCSYQRYVNTKEYLSYVAETIRHFGYTRSSDEGISTAIRALDFYDAAHGRAVTKEYLQDLLDKMRSVNFDIDSDLTVKLVSDALAWVSEQEENSNYIHNLKTACSLEYVKGNFGLYASLFPAYDRDLERTAKRKAVLDIEQSSEYVGEISDRITVKVQSVKCVTSWETDFGVTHIYKIIGADGNVYTWKTGKYIDDTVDEMSITGTVKAHTEFRGIKQTELTRCRVAAQHPARKGETMNKLRRKNIQEVIDKLTSLQNDLESLESDVESIQDEEIEYRDNMPENLQGSERYEQADSACDSLETARDGLADLKDSIDEIISSLEDAAQQKEGDEVKKIVAAWIEQILEFPTKLEYLAYMESLKKGRPQKFKETSFEQLESGVVRITIRKQYNNNAFPDDEKEGEK